MFYAPRTHFGPGVRVRVPGFRVPRFPSCGAQFPVPGFRGLGFPSGGF